MVAYGLYKSRKREWLIEFRRGRGGQGPSPEQEEIWRSAYISHLGDLRARAENMLSSVTLSYAEQAADTYRQEGATQYAATESARAVREIQALAKQTLHEVGDESKKGRSWPRAIGQNIAGAVIYSALLVFAYVVIKVYGTGWENLFGTLSDL